MPSKRAWSLSGRRVRCWFRRGVCFVSMPSKRAWSLSGELRLRVVIPASCLNALEAGLVSVGSTPTLAVYRAATGLNALEAGLVSVGCGQPFGPARRHRVSMPSKRAWSLSGTSNSSIPIMTARSQCPRSGPGLCRGNWCMRLRAGPRRLNALEAGLVSVGAPLAIRWKPRACRAGFASQAIGVPTRSKLGGRGSGIIVITS